MYKYKIHTHVRAHTHTPFTLYYAIVLNYSGSMPLENITYYIANGVSFLMI